MKIVKRAVVLILVVATTLFILWPPLFLSDDSPIGSISQRIAAYRFYTNLAEGDLDDAFEIVHYFDSGSDVPPEIALADARTIWKTRVEAQQKEGIYLIAMKDLDLWFDDMSPRGTAIVEMSVDGVHREIKHDIHFMPNGSFGMKILGVRAVYEPFVVDDTFTRYNAAISGSIRKDAGSQ